MFRTFRFYAESTDKVSVAHNVSRQLYVAPMPNCAGWASFTYQYAVYKNTYDISQIMNVDAYSQTTTSCILIFIYRNRFT